MKRTRYSVAHDPTVGRFAWLVIDATSGESALWRKGPKVGRVPLRFKSQAATQATADRMNADGK